MNGAERNTRALALAALAVMMIIFIVLSAFSFIDSRGQVTPDEFTYASYEAVEGKRVFQAYNCMGCHTIVGNGAYFGPDLTGIYKKAGPAWLAAFLPSASSWPTEAAVRTQLVNPDVQAETGGGDIGQYFTTYPAAAERVERRGGGKTFMPTLPITAQETGELIAFLKYTSSMNTEGWPPEPKVDGLTFPQARRAPNAAVVTASASSSSPGANTATPSATATAAPEALGAEVVKSYGCLSCHAADASRLVGPGWGGLFGSQVTLADGSTVTADEAYLSDSILDPNAQVVDGFPAGVMPAYQGVMSQDELDAVVAYIRSLETP